MRESLMAAENKKCYSVLIAHQSTISPYRTPFYEELERQRPDWWDFTVAYDPKVSRWLHFGEIGVDSGRVPIRATRTIVLFTWRKKRIVLQSFILSLWNYHCIVVEDALNNLSYPLAFLYRFFGKKVFLWGHCRDLAVATPSGLKRWLEGSKRWLARRANGYMAYTGGVKDYLIDQGLSPNKMFVLNNTIDILRQREVFKKFAPQRDQLRNERGLSGCKVLLYIGRITFRKRLDFLVRAFEILFIRDPRYRLAIVGDGDLSLISNLSAKLGGNAIECYGPLTDEDALGALYVSGDLFVLPGHVGLAPLQALCYDLIPVVVQLHTHSPEIEYLREQNTCILPEGTAPPQYARAIEMLLQDTKQFQGLGANAWPSIKHLTIENMAKNFITGINTILQSKD